MSDAKSVRTKKEVLYGFAWNLYGEKTTDDDAFVSALTNSLKLVYNDATLSTPIELEVDTTGATTNEQIIEKIKAVLPTSALNGYVEVDFEAGEIDYSGTPGYYNMKFRTDKKGKDVSLKLLKANGTTQFDGNGSFTEE